MRGERGYNSKLSFSLQFHKLSNDSQPISTTQLGRFSTPLTGQNCKSLVRGICTKFSITNLLLGHRVLGQH